LFSRAYVKHSIVDAFSIKIPDLRRATGKNIIKQNVIATCPLKLAKPEGVDKQRLERSVATQ
jgi:hypothetical protein